MRKLMTVAALSAAVFLSGCGLADMGDGEGSAQQQLADRLLGAVAGQEGRQARLALVVAAYSELLAERVVNYEPSAAPEAVGNLAKLRGVIEAYGQADDPVFIETDLRHASIELAKVGQSAVIDRVTGVVGVLAGGLGVNGAVTQARLAAAQAALGEALVTDLRNAVTRMQEDVAAIEGVRQAAMDRLAANEARIMAILSPAAAAAVRATAGSAAPMVSAGAGASAGAAGGGS